MALAAIPINTSSLDFCSVASSVSSSKRVCRIDSKVAARPPTVWRSAIATGALTAADQRAHEHTDQAGNADGTPWIVVHVIVSDAHGTAPLGHEFVLGGIQMFASAAQRPHGRFAQFVSLLASGFGRLLQHAFGFIETAFDLLDELFFLGADVFLVHCLTPVVGCAAREHRGHGMQAPYPMKRRARQAS